MKQDTQVKASPLLLFPSTLLVEMLNCKMARKKRSFKYRNKETGISNLSRELAGAAKGRKRGQRGCWDDPGSKDPEAGGYPLAASWKNRSSEELERRKRMKCSRLRHLGTGEEGNVPSR